MAALGLLSPSPSWARCWQLQRQPGRCERGGHTLGLAAGAGSQLAGDPMSQLGRDLWSTGLRGSQPLWALNPAGERGGPSGLASHPASGTSAGPSLASRGGRQTSQQCPLSPVSSDGMTASQSHLISVQVLVSDMRAGGGGRGGRMGPSRTCLWPLSEQRRGVAQRPLAAAAAVVLAPGALSRGLR